MRSVGRRRLGEVLVSQGVLTELQLAESLAAQADVPAGEPRLRLGPLVVERGLVAERDITQALAAALDLELIDLTRISLDPEIPRLLPRAVAERHGILLLSRTPRGGFRVAMGDPTDVVALDDVKLYTGATELIVAVAADSQVRDHVRRAWALADDSGGKHLASMLSGLGSFEDAQRRRRPGRRHRRAGRPAGQRDVRRGRTPGSQRHPRRAAAAGSAHPLPGRRPAPRGDDRTEAGDSSRRQPDQGHVRPRHRRTAQAAGRPGPAAGRRPGDRRPDQHPADGARRKARHPAAQPWRQRRSAEPGRLREPASSRPCSPDWSRPRASS